MTSETRVHEADLAIIGPGLSGMSAALFAANKKMSTVLIGRGNTMNFASGLMDLMGIWPPSNEWEDPWAGIARVREEIPGHPYAAISDESIRQAFTELTAFINAQGLTYRKAARRNVNIITSLGTIKKTWAVPDTMWNGVLALERRSPSLIVDFSGMSLFSAGQIVSILSDQWPGLSFLRITFPGTGHFAEVSPEYLARALDVPANRKRLADLLVPHLGSEAYVGFPAVLGITSPGETAAELETLLGKPVFEIPMPPVSVPGIRLHESLIRGLGQKAQVHYMPHSVKEVRAISGKGFCLTIESEGRQRHVRSRGVLLCTGRFLGKGLVAERSGIREPLLGLPVIQPESRRLWHHSALFHSKGHPLNLAGIQVDERFRPLTTSGMPFANNLYAAGSVLANSNWTRLKCGAGVAVASAHAAVAAFEKKM
jgi:glycerol-3-phosphate dehydrogenase subunit B